MRNRKYITMPLPHAPPPFSPSAFNCRQSHQIRELPARHVFDTPIPTCNYSRSLLNRIAIVKLKFTVLSLDLVDPAIWPFRYG